MQVIYQLEVKSEHATERGARVTQVDELVAGVLMCPSELHVAVKIGQQVEKAVFYVDNRGRLRVKESEA